MVCLSTYMSLISLRRSLQCRWQCYYREIQEICMLILHPTTSLNLFINSKVCFRFHEIFYIWQLCKKRCFYFFLYDIYLFICELLHSLVYPRKRWLEVMRKGHPILALRVFLFFFQLEMNIRFHKMFFMWLLCGS